MGIERFPGQTEILSTDGFPSFHKTQISDELPNGSKQKIGTSFTLILRQLSFQRQSYGVNREVVCQLPPEASHPRHIAARLKKHTSGMNDAPDAGGTFLTRHWATMAWFPREPNDAVTFCTQHSRVHNGAIKETSQLNPRVRTEADVRQHWILLQEAQLQENPCKESLILC